MVEYIAIGISLVAIIVTLGTNSIAKKANKKSEEANKIALKANEKSEEANKIALNANEKSEEANEIASESLKYQKTEDKESRRPDINILSFIVDPEMIKVYGGNNVTWEEKEEAFPEKYIGIIKSKKRSATNTRFTNSKGEPKDYYFINLCHEDTAVDDIVFILDVATLIIEIDGPQATEFEFVKNYSLLSTKDSFAGKDFNLDYKKNITGTSVEIPIAYAAVHSMNTSLDLHNFAKLSASTNKDPIDLIADENIKVGHYIRFIETGYVFSLLTASNENYEYSTQMSREADSLVFKPPSNDRKRFDERVVHWGNDEIDDNGNVVRNGLVDIVFYNKEELDKRSG